MQTVGPYNSCVPCPMCKHRMGVSSWSFCRRCLEWAAAEIERREEVKRRRTDKRCCANCGADPVRFEYLITPVRKSRRVYSGFRQSWYPLCDPCIRAWIMYGTLEHPEVDGAPVGIPLGSCR